MRSNSAQGECLGIRIQISSAAFEGNGQLGGLCFIGSSPGLFPHLKVLDELLHLDPKIDAFDVVHTVISILFIKVSC
jgi:hypothetical protein